MVKRKFTYDQWQDIMDALPAEQSDLEDRIAEQCEESDTNSVEMEMSVDEAAVVDLIHSELQNE